MIIPKTNPLPSKVGSNRRYARTSDHCASLTLLELSQTLVSSVIISALITATNQQPTNPNFWLISLNSRGKRQRTQGHPFSLNSGKGDVACIMIITPSKFMGERVQCSPLYFFGEPILPSIYKNLSVTKKNWKKRKEKKEEQVH